MRRPLPRGSSWTIPISISYEPFSTQLRVTWRWRIKKRQLTVLEAAFRRPNPRPAVRGELNRVRREGIAGQALLDVLSRVYHLHGLQAVRARRDESEDENHALPRIVCSEAFRPS